MSRTRRPRWCEGMSRKPRHHQCNANALILDFKVSGPGWDVIDQNGPNPRLSLDAKPSEPTWCMRYSLHQAIATCGIAVDP